MRKFNSSGGPISLGWALLSGGIAGTATWAVVYPLDYIKTLIQTDDLAKPRHTSSIGYLK